MIEIVKCFKYKKIAPVYCHDVGFSLAGMTCAGGGAVAFPVMTLAFSVSPSVARDVSLMIQSCGMSCASFTIFFMKVQIEHLTLGLCFTSAIAGTIFGLHVIDPLMDPPVKKMVFVSMWFAFAFVLYLLNRDPNRTVYNKIQDVRPWKVAVLLLTGFIGGIFSAWAGSGLDLCVFSVVTTLFRLSEKIATPTSVILMATNSIVTIFWRAMVLGDVELEAWQFISVTAPIVTVGAPFGSLIGSHFHREVLAAALYIITTVSLIGAFVIVDQTVLLGCLSAGVMITSCSIFMGLTHAGKKLYLHTEQKQLGEKNLKELKALENGSKFHLNGNGVNPSVSAFEDIREEPICVVSTATKF